jgi:hypothetical protein
MVTEGLPFWLGDHPLAFFRAAAGQRQPDSALLPRRARDMPRYV